MEKIALEYIWIWIAAALNIIAYVLLGLIIKRVDENGFQWKATMERCMYCDTPMREQRIKAVQMYL